MIQSTSSKEAAVYMANLLNLSEDAMIYQLLDMDGT